MKIQGDDPKYDPKYIVTPKTNLIKLAPFVSHAT